MRTAEDLVARAETNKTGIAIILLSDTARDISLETAGAARVRLGQIRPKPHTIERAEALPMITRFLNATPDAEILWLSDGVDLGHSAEFVEGLVKATGGRPVTVIEGGIEPARALAAAENTAGALTVKVLRAATDGGDNGVVRARSREPAARRCALRVQGGRREADAQFDMPVEIRNDIARLEISGERSAGVVQARRRRPHRRRDLGRDQRNRQPLLVDLLPARALGPFADMHCRAHLAGEAVQFLEEFADADPGRRRHRGGRRP